MQIHRWTLAAKSADTVNYTMYRVSGAGESYATNATGDSVAGIGATVVRGQNGLVLANFKQQVRQFGTSKETAEFA